MKASVVSLLLILTTSIALSACSTDKTPPTTSYYHWANTYNPDAKLLKTRPPQRLYIKWLDIGLHQGNIQVHQTQIDSSPKVPVTPVVFLDQRILKQQTTEQLLETILQRIPPAEHTSLQVDCDWTDSTRDLYFKLLTLLKPSYDDLSVTLRLHQIKYAQRTGTPPADKGVLMYYNMSTIQDPSTKNYVLDNAIGKQYLQNFASYELPVDLALPLYQQTRVVRQHKLVRLIGNIEINADKTVPLNNAESNRYRVTQAHYWQGYYLYKDDELVIDAVTKEDLKQAAKLLSPMLHPREIIYYKWRDAKRFTPEFFDEIANYFNQPDH